MLYYNAWYYDPQLGRFLRADTVGYDFSNPQSANRYAYALNNPFKYTDSSGHYSERGTDEDRASCVQNLADYGVNIVDPNLWEGIELYLIWEAIMDWQSATCKIGSCSSKEDFVKAF